MARRRLAKVFLIAICSLAAIAAQAAGLRVLDVPGGGDVPALTGAV